MKDSGINEHIIPQRHWYPCSNGHPAWPLQAKTIEETAIEDLFGRKLQTDHHLTEEIVRAAWPEAEKYTNNMIISVDLCVAAHRKLWCILLPPC